jgi:hypothetical protein
MGTADKLALSNEGWDCSLYPIEVGARGHIIKSVKDRLWTLFRAWIPVGHRSGIGQMMKDDSRISLVCSFAIFQARKTLSGFLHGLSCNI